MRDLQERTVHRLSRTVVIAAALAVGLLEAVACNDAPLIEPAICRPGQCTCEEDPTQAVCRGYGGGSGSGAGGDAGGDAPTRDAVMPDSGDDAPVEALDGGDDAG